MIAKMNQSVEDHPAASRGRVSLEHQVFEVSVYRSSGYESSSLTLLQETRINRNAANSENERMIEEEPQKEWQDVIEPEADGKSEESSSENVCQLEVIPDMIESPCQQESLPKQSLEDEESEGIGEDDKVKQDEKEEAEQPVKKTGKRRIIRKQVNRSNKTKEPAQQHSRARRSKRFKMKLRKRKGSVNYKKGINAIVELHEKGVSPKEISSVFGIQRSNLNKWKSQMNNASKKELDSKNSSNCETIYASKNSKTEKIKQNALTLFRQGMTVTQISLKMCLDKNLLAVWTRPLIRELKKKYVEGLKIIETAIIDSYQEGSNLFVKDVEKVFQQTLIDDFFLSSKDWIYFTIKKLNLHQRFKLFKYLNRRKVQSEEILESSYRLLKKYRFLRDFEEDKKEVFDLRKQGKTLTQICSLVAISERTIRNLIEQIDEENVYFGWNENQSLKVYQKIIKNKKRGSVIKKRDIRDCAHSQIIDPTFMAVDEWIEKFIEFYKLSSRYEIRD